MKANVINLAMQKSEIGPILLCEKRMPFDSPRHASDLIEN